MQSGGSGSGTASAAGAPALQRPVMLGSEIYRQSSYGAWHPLRIPRVSTVMDLARALGWLPADQFRTSPRAKPAALQLFHTPDYVAALQDAEATQQVTDAVRIRHGLGTASNPVFPEMFRRPATSAGGSLLAGELLRDGGIVHHPAGGTHHAFADRAGGFCYFNDPVLAILSLRRVGVRRIAYIDIDAHHPDGVEAALGDDPDMLMISTHEEGRWPRTGALTDEGAGGVYNLPVPPGFNDTEMAFVRDELILPAVAVFRPDAVVIQCGADAVLEDPQSRLALSNNAHFELVAALRPMSPRFLVLGGGGYNPWTVGRLWTGVWAVLNGIALPEELPEAGRAVLAGLRWTRTGSTREIMPPPSLVTTLRDPRRPGAVSESLREKVGLQRTRLGVWV